MKYIWTYYLVVGDKNYTVIKIYGLPLINSDKNFMGINFMAAQFRAHELLWLLKDKDGYYMTWLSVMPQLSLGIIFDYYGTGMWKQI